MRTIPFIIISILSIFCYGQIICGYDSWKSDPFNQLYPFQKDTKQRRLLEYIGIYIYPDGTFWFYWDFRNSYGYWRQKDSILILDSGRPQWHVMDLYLEKITGYEFQIFSYNGNPHYRTIPYENSKLYVVTENSDTLIKKADYNGKIAIGSDTIIKEFWIDIDRWLFTPKYCINDLKANSTDEFHNNLFIITVDQTKQFCMEDWIIEFQSDTCRLRPYNWYNKRACYVLTKRKEISGSAKEEYKKYTNYQMHIKKSKRMIDMNSIHSAPFPKRPKW